MGDRRSFELPLDGVLVGEAGGSGPPLILIHGWALDRRMWSQQQRAFRRHFRTVSYDRRSFGRNTCAPDLERELDDLDAIRAALHIDRVALLGMSQGGRVALRYALKRPAAVSALILHGAPYESTPPPPGDPAHLPLRDYAALVARGRTAELHKALGAHPLLRVGHRYPAARAALMGMIERYRGADLVGTGVGRTGAFADLRKSLASLQVPTLVLTGEREAAWLKAAADRLVDALPQAERMVVHGGGHLVNMTAARAYNRTIIRWLETRVT